MDGSTSGSMAFERSNSTSPSLLHSAANACQSHRRKPSGGRHKHNASDVADETTGSRPRSSR
eukprot:10212414-Lingulodinium_polyedra.AAC.1